MNVCVTQVCWVWGVSDGRPPRRASQVGGMHLVRNIDGSGRARFAQFNAQSESYINIREGSKKKKPEKVWSFAKPGGGVPKCTSITNPQVQ